MHKIDFHTPKYMMVYDICINITAINSNCDTTKCFGQDFCSAWCSGVYWSWLQRAFPSRSVSVSNMRFVILTCLLSTLSGMTRSVCFLECVRHQLGHSPCRGFHFRPKEGVCELLPEESRPWPWPFTVVHKPCHTERGPSFPKSTGRYTICGPCSAQRHVVAGLGNTLCSKNRGSWWGAVYLSF